MTKSGPDPGPLDPATQIGPQLLSRLRERIVRAELSPGTRLSEQEVASTYGFSRQPVREAFIRLAEEGLLEIRPQRGTYVRRISAAAVRDARFVREAVEADLVRLAALEADADALADLSGLIDRQEAVAEDDPAEFMRLDEAFHRRLAEVAGLPRAWYILEPIKAQMDRVRFLTTSQFPTGRIIAQHRAIRDAVVRADPAAAEAAMRGHLRMILDDLPAIIASQPAFFEPG